jgi:hypothetical protein
MVMLASCLTKGRKNFVMKGKFSEMKTDRFQELVHQNSPIADMKTDMSKWFKTH